MATKTNKPIAVITGDIHYCLQTLEVADKATRMAIAKANELGVPFVANGDTTDTKAILRAECMNVMTETFKTAKTRVYINIGNHCKINNKSTEHAMGFLASCADIVSVPTYIAELQSYVVPYHDDIDKLRDYLKTIPKNSRLIMHQGLLKANAGHYMQDPSALSIVDIADFRVVLSHYHARQDIRCGLLKAKNVGLASYVGSPYTFSFAEVEDLDKGFQILYEDGSLKLVPTNLRRHEIIEWNLDDESPDASGDSILWLKVTGTAEQLAGWTKEKIAKQCMIEGKDFKLDLITLEDKTEAPAEQNLSQQELFDKLIDSLQHTDKPRLKSMWREFTTKE